MTDPKYMRPGLPFAVGKAVEELGELQAAMGKTLRWGWDSVNPELPEHAQETNFMWVQREIADVRGALDNLEREMAKEFGLSDRIPDLPQEAPEPVSSVPEDTWGAFGYLVSRCASGLYKELVEKGRTDAQARNAVIHSFLDMASGEACRVARSEGRKPDESKWQKATKDAFDRAVARTSSVSRPNSGTQGRGLM